MLPDGQRRVQDTLVTNFQANAQMHFKIQVFYKMDAQKQCKMHICYKTDAQKQ